ncbi:MAG: hypothetical protein DRO23_02055 [Thermoprotei archaeon]|nr:MAG: hypothetical protein DRO23_02055 [Thermoprotei archaeon]
MTTAKTKAAVAVLIIIVLIAVAAMYFMYLAPGKEILTVKGEPEVVYGEEKATIKLVLENTDAKATAKVARVEYVVFVRGIYAERGHQILDVTIGPKSTGTVTVETPWTEEYTGKAEIRLTFTYTYDGSTSTLKYTVKA